MRAREKFGAVGPEKPTSHKLELGTESQAIEVRTVIHAEFDTHTQNEGKADSEAPSLSSKSDSSTHDQQPGLS